VAEPANPQLTDVIEQLSLMRENLSALFTGEETAKKDKKKTAKELVKVRIDDIQSKALEKITEALGDISTTTKKTAKGKEEKEKDKDKSGGLLSQVGGAIGKFVGEAFGSAASAGTIYAPLLALGIGGGIGLAALGIAGAIKIIAPALPMILEFIKAVLPEFSKFVGDILPKFSKFINDVLGGEGFLKFIRTITEFYRNVLKDMFAALPNIIKGIGEAIKKVLEGVSEVCKQIPAIISAITKGIAEIIKPIAEAIKNIISDFIKTLPSLLAQIPPILAAIKPFFDRLMDFAEDTVDVIIDFAKYLIDKLPVIRNFLEPIIDLIKDLAGKYVQLLTTGITALKDAVIVLIEKGLNPLITGLRDVLISAFENLQKIIESLATAAIALGNNIENILVKAFNTLDSVVRNIINFFETMPGKISDFIKSIVQSVKDLANISKADLVNVAGGITAIGVALAALGAGGLIKGFTDLFSKDPVKELKRFTDIKDDLKATADAIKLLADSLKMLGADGLGKSISENLKAITQSSLKMLGADGLGKSISENLKAITQSLKEIPIETLKVAGPIIKTTREEAPASEATSKSAVNEKANDLLGEIKEAIDTQYDVLDDSKSLLAVIAQLLGQSKSGSSTNVIVNKVNSNNFSMAEGTSRANIFRSEA